MSIIISASRKEDIIKNASRYEELQSIVSDGVYQTYNQFRGMNITSFNTSDVGAVVLWSKDYANFIKNPGALANYNLYFQFTITGYGKRIEPNVIHYEETIKQMREIAKIYSPEAINWRFDPIAFFDCKGNDPIAERLETFELICESVAEFGIKRCTISFLSTYGAVVKRLKSLGITYKKLSEDEEVLFLEKLVKIAEKHDIQLYSCSSPSILRVSKIKESACIDGEVLSKLFNLKFSKAKDKGQRADCKCVKSIDVGNYIGCPHSCVYCYARPN